MEALIILVVLGILVYLIYNNLPSSKFNTASQLLNKQKFTEAQAVYKTILSKHELAVTRYAECFYMQAIKCIENNQIESALNLLNEAVNTKAFLNSKSGFESYSLVEAKSYYEIAKIQFNQIKRVNSIETIIALKNNVEFIKAINKSKIESVFWNLEILHYPIIAEIYFILGMEEEKRNEIIKAKSNYSNAISTIKEFEKNGTYHNSLIRNKICKLKIGETLNETIINEFKTKESPYKKEFYYRYSIHLIKEKLFEKAENILINELRETNPHFDNLRRILQREKVKKAIESINQINTLIDALHNGLNDDETLNFYNSLTTKANEIKTIVPDVTSQIEELRPSILNRLLTCYYDNDEYGKAINIMLKFPNFYDSPVLMKNLGNSCMNFVEKGQLSEKNYKTIISVFLTSAFSDKVMLNSIEDTVWDDDYSFTLCEAIGSAYQYHSELPNNVNYDEVSEVNISIGEAQRELLRQFESLLKDKIYDIKLLNEIHSFYDTEKDALEKIVSIIPNEITFASPYFAKLFKIHEPILRELENEYYDSSNDEVLEVGIHFNLNNSSSIITEYCKAKRLLHDIIDAIESENIAMLNKASSHENLEIIKNFDSLCDNLEDEMIKSFHKRIELDEENEKIIPLFQRAINISLSDDKLKFQYANFVSNLCVVRVNTGKMKKLRALQLMSDAYICLPDSIRICKNIIALIKMNIIDAVTERSYNATEIFAILEEIYENRSVTFIQNARELSEARMEILNELPSSVQIAIRTGTNLSSEGNILRKGLDYLYKLSAYN